MFKKLYLELENKRVVDADTHQQLILMGYLEIPKTRLEKLRKIIMRIKWQITI